MVRKTEEIVGKEEMFGKRRMIESKEIASTASTFLSDYMPFLSEGMCARCSEILQSRLESLASSGKINGIALSNGKAENSADFCSLETNSYSPGEKPVSLSNGYKESSQGSSNRTLDSESSAWRGHVLNFSPSTSNQHSFSKQSSVDDFSEVSSAESALADDLGVKNGSSLSREEREHIRFFQVGRKKDFIFMEWINGKRVNVLQGLELHTRVFSAAEQKKIVDCVYNFQRMGQKGQLRERTYSEPRKWMRGKGRVTIQFGCCYNYAMDKNGNAPGIIRDEEVDPIPSLFKMIIKRLVRWHVLPPTCVPDSCIVNIYDEGDCIPPHIDHHDFLRPFCTVSFLTECNILFGSNLKIAGPGEFSGPVSILLPVGSVLVLNGNGADVAKHCVPGVPGKRISITFRKMDDSKLPYRFKSDPELQGLQPYVPGTSQKSPNLQVGRAPTQHNTDQQSGNKAEVPKETENRLFKLGQDEDNFPPLARLNLMSKPRGK